MSETGTVKLYISGHLIEGANRAEAVIKLADMLKTSPAKIARLIDGNPHLIKKDLPAAQAGKYQQALAAAGFETIVKGDSDAASAGDTAAASSAPPATAAPDSLALMELGALVLAADERAPQRKADIRTDHLDIAEAGSRIAEAPPAASPVAAPDIGLAEHGAAIENVPKPPPPPAPNTDQLSTAEPGTELGVAKPAPPPPPDVSHLSLDDDDHPPGKKHS